MSLKSDFLKWEDLDLDILLEEYTDDECLNDCLLGSSETSDSESEAVDVVPTLPPRSAPLKTKPNYKCPVCNKMLRSVSGFRGHVTKQHPGYTATATGQCTDAVEGATVSGYGASNQALLEPTFTEQTFSKCFNESYTRSWDCILNDPLLLIPNSAHGPRVLACASVLKDVDGAPLDKLKGAVSVMFVNKVIVGGSDDTISMARHKLACNEEIENEFLTFTSTTGLPTSIGRGITLLTFKTFLRRLVDNILQFAKSANVAHKTGVLGKLTESEQNVMYYVSGFVSKKAVAGTENLVKLKPAHAFAATFSSKTPKTSDHFVMQYSVLVDKQSRGGLQYPCPDFYLLIREFDIQYARYIMQQGDSVKIPPKQQLRDVF